MAKTGAKSGAQKPSKGKSSSSPEEFSPTSTQPVEAMDKSTQTHSSNAQKSALKENESGGSSKRPAHAGHSAAQHAIGSFTGAGGDGERGSRGRR
jgi:hypothetical protein